MEKILFSIEKSEGVCGGTSFSIEKSEQHSFNKTSEKPSFSTEKSEGVCRRASFSTEKYERREK